MTLAHCFRAVWRGGAALLMALSLAGCASVGVSVPLGPLSVGIGVGSGGVSARVGAGVGPVSASVGLGSEGASAGVGVRAGPVGVGVSADSQGQITGSAGVGAATAVGAVQVGASAGASRVLRPAQGLRSARVNACCLKHTTLPGVGLGTEADGVAGGTAALKAPACCQRDCCAQAPSSTNRIPLAAQASPDLSRLLPGVVILTLSWTLPSAPVICRPMPCWPLVAKKCC